MNFLPRSLFVLIISVALATTTGVIPAFAQDADAPPPPPEESATIMIRDGATIISGGSVSLPADGSPDVAITPSVGGSSYNVPARSVLSILKDIESATTTFSLSDLQYSSAYNSFYLNCVTAPADPASPLCGNWQYVVNGTSPGIGMDTKTLSDGDVVYLYFGPSRRITPSASVVTVGTPFTVTAESYVASSNSWSPATGLTMRIIQGDPFNSPTTIFSSTTGADGSAGFTIRVAGSYAAGLAEDFYFPNAQITATTQTVSSGSRGGINLHAPFDVAIALAYLERQQLPDGSFGSALLSDWAAMAFASGGAGDAKRKLSQYFISNPPSFSKVTDYERHAMALEALGIDPHTGTSIDYISPIANSFDGVQIGDTSLVNDDVFALFPLLHAGYSTNDEVIQKTVQYILSKQLSNGAWENSVDLTAAAVQALSLVRQLPDANNAVNSAMAYLQSKFELNGGFGNSFSTSWSLQAIAAVPSSHLSWANGYNTPQYYLATLQERDGGVEPVSTASDTRLWATAYAIPAIQGKTWGSLLTSFAHPTRQSAAAPATTEPATTTDATPAPTSSVAVESSNTSEALLSTSIQLERQGSEVEQVSGAPVPEPVPGSATSTEATTTLAHISPKYVQTAAIAVVDYGIPGSWKLWLAILVLLAFITGLWRGFRKRERS